MSSKEGLDPSSFYFHVNLSKELDKQAPDWCSGALFFLATLFHVPFLLHFFLDFHPLGRVKQSTFHRASAALWLVHAVDTEKEEGRDVCRSRVFPPPLNSTSL